MEKSLKNGCQYEKMERIERVKFWRFNSVRLQITLLLCLNFFVLAVMRNNLGIAIVCMVNRTDMEDSMKNDGKNSTGNRSAPVLMEGRKEECSIPDHFRDEYQGEFSWTSSQQGMLFAAVYWGSFSALPAGWLSDRYSPKMVLLISGLVNVVATALIPIAAWHGGYPVVFIMRCLAGLGQGLQRPGTNALVVRWIPIDERSTVVSLYTTGTQLAGIFSTPLFAWFCGLRTFWGGWPLIFFTSSALGMIWCIIWCFLGSNDPRRTGRIANRELEYIASKLQFHSGAQRKKAVRNIPWRNLLTSMPLIACVLCSIANGMVLSLSGSYIPTYFMDVLHLDLKSNGFFGALPYIVQWAMKFVSAALADNLLRSGKIRSTLLSKIFNTIASVGTAGFLFACTCLTCDYKPLAITFLCLSFGFFGVFVSGYWTSMVNIAPIYAGTICSLATAALTLGAVLAPYLVGAIVIVGSREEWRVVFGIIAVSLTLSGIFYIIFGSADLQSWAVMQSEQEFQIAVTLPTNGDRANDERKASMVLGRQFSAT